MLNKKGVIFELGNIIKVFFFFLIMFGLVYLVWDSINTEFQGLDDDILAPTYKSDIDKLGNTFKFLDKIIPFIYFLMWGIVIYNSINSTPEHPIFYIISMGSLLMFTLLSILFVDLGTEIFSNSIFSPILDNISNTSFFINNYHYISFGIMLISLVWYFRKTKSAEARGII